MMKGTKMSNLKYMSVEELQNLKSQLNGQQQRLEWINKYIFEKTPQEMSISQIEAVLGHKIIISET